MLTDGSVGISVGWKRPVSGRGFITTSHTTYFNSNIFTNTGWHLTLAVVIITLKGFM